MYFNAVGSISCADNHRWSSQCKRAYKKRILTKTEATLRQSNFLGFSVNEGGGTPGHVCYQPREIDGPDWGRNLGGEGEEEKEEEEEEEE